MSDLLRQQLIENDNNDNQLLNNNNHDTNNDNIDHDLISAITSKSSSNSYYSCECGLIIPISNLPAHKNIECKNRNVNYHEDYCWGKSAKCKRCGHIDSKRKLLIHLAVAHKVNPCVGVKEKINCLPSNLAKNNNPNKIDGEDPGLVAALAESIKDPLVLHYKGSNQESLVEDKRNENIEVYNNNDWEDLVFEENVPIETYHDKDIEAAIKASLGDTNCAQISLDKLECPICQVNFSTYPSLEEHVTICSMEFDD